MQKEKIKVKKHQLKVKNNKLAVIVPYRDRKTQLSRFLKHMETYLSEYTYQIFIIEQCDNKPFNRGKLLNIGYKIACEHQCDYFVFHDVDMLPYKVDYSYTDKPLHLATHLQENDYETTFFDYFGGVTLFNKEDFATINGYSNEYWGWGFEDDDLLIRCVQSNLEMDVELSGDEHIKTFETFKFDGDASYIELTKLKKSNALSDDFTISVMVKPSDIQLNSNKKYDELPIVSIPGYNIGIFYNSFRRFFCQTYDMNKSPYSITTDILGERWVHLVMVLKNSKEVYFYLDGKLVDKIIMEDDILNLLTDKIYIGSANGKKDNRDFFYGNIASVEMFDIALEESEIVSIYENSLKPKMKNFGDYKSSEFLYFQLLAELSTNETCIDLAGEYKAKLNNVEFEKLNQSFRTFLPKPHRRDSKFKSLKHKSNSSIGNHWVHSETRKNQLKYYNEVRRNILDYHIDGLNTLRYDEIETKTISSNVSHIKVNL
jgi:predicted glycosyltransferase involved in capsule biosynthesis